MAINLRFDLAGNPEPPTIILANKNGNILGQLKVNTDSIDLSDCFSDASEFSFTLNKYVDGEFTHLWDKVVNFKLVYCKEWDCWFEIKVELDEQTETVKTVFCTQLGQAELSQIMLYNIEINTEKDIERDDYKISILYDSSDPDASILDRLIKDKAPHYSIAYVSPTIAKIQRSFSFDGASILDAFQDIEEEVGCIFQYYADLDEDGTLRRKIAVYDLQQTCDDCGHRGEYTDKCPKCNSANITSGYGDDTLIFVTSDELASGGIQFVTDTDSVKNCFKLEAGDDLMTSTIRSCNPNGTDYIWRFSDSVKEDMSNELVEKLDSYNEIYKQYYDGYVSNIDEDLLEKYNSLIDKYSANNEDFQKMATPITGYASLMNAYYNAIDLELYLTSGLMPNAEMSDTNAEEQLSLLTTSSLSPIAVADVTIASLATINSAVLAMAKTIIRPTYKIQIGSSELIDSVNSRSWKGNFIITNYSDEEDTAVGSPVSVVVSDDMESFVKQKLDKALNKENTDDLSISGLFEMDYDDFCEELKKYALNPLTSFHDACQSCIDIMIDQGVGNGNSWSDKESGSDGNLYEKLYIPYYNKLKAIELETKVREDEIGIVSGIYDADGNLVKEGLMANIEECRKQIQAALNFEDYLGKKLWLEFCAYRREDKYSNENYISDGLNNVELFKKALEFFELAQNEIYKSSELQHSISTTLNNLLAIKKFKDLVKYFKVGNWMRVQVDDKVFKLRLLKYDISYGDFDNIGVDFSDVIKIKNGTTDVRDVLEQASSMATSYSSVQRQANQGGRAKTTLEQWIDTGLNSALVQIQNNDNEEISLTKNGLLCRSYDDVTDTYSPEQIKLTHNIIAYTDDEWRTVRQAIGKHEYVLYDKDKGKFIDNVGYGMNADFVTAGVVSGSQIIGGDIYSDNYSVVDGTGSYLNLRDGTFSFGGGALRFEGGELLISSPNVVTKNEVTEINEKYLKTTTVYAENLQVKSANINGQLTAEQINTEGLIAENIYGTTITGKTISGGSLLIGNKSGDYAEITPSGILNCRGANITGIINATGGTIGGCVIDEENGLQVDVAHITGTLVADEVSAKKITSGVNENAEITFNGKFTAPSAEITGTIIAEDGQIGGWKIFDDLLGSAAQSSSHADGHYYGIALDTKTTSLANPSTNVLAIGKMTGVNGVIADSEEAAISGWWNQAAFRVSSDGSLYAGRGVIGGWTFEPNGFRANGSFISPDGTFAFIPDKDDVVNENFCSFQMSSNGYYNFALGADCSLQIGKTSIDEAKLQKLLALI